MFGPENGAVSEKLVFEAAREAHAKGYAHLYVIGFAIQPNARLLIDKAEETMGIAAAYMEATRDLTMGDLLKTMRSSQIFSVCGMPDVTLRKLKSERKDAPARYEVELLGLDMFDPATMETARDQGRRRAGVVPRHRLQRPLFPRLAGVFSAHERVGQPQEGAARRLTRKAFGTIWRERRAPRSRRASTARSRSR